MSKQKKEEERIASAIQEQAVAPETLENFNHQKVIDDISEGGSYLIDGKGKLTRIEEQEQ